MHILVVTHQYPPMPSVGGNRWLAMSKYLRQLDMEVDVLTTAAFGSLPSDGDQNVHRAYDLIGARWLRRAIGRPPLPEPGMPAIEDTPVPAIVTKLVVPDHCAVTWVPFASYKARRLLRRRRYDCVVSTSAFESTHLIPLLLGSDRPAWIADLRDGWTFHPWREPFPTRTQRRLDAALERRVVTTADRTTCVELPVAEDLNDRLGIGAVQVPNGWDPELGAEADATVAASVLDPERVSLVHTGKLSGPWGRNPAPLLEALRRLRARSPETSQHLQLVLAGRLDREERELIESFDLGALVRVLGPLSRAESIALQRRADAVVAITAPDLPWELPGKLFEYLGSGRPILALAEGNEAARIVEETNTGTTVPPDEVDAILAALSRVASGDLAREYAPRNLERYTYPGPAEQMAEMIEEAIRRHAERR
jgi:glycosyltransferase involved in cell wall biosynthesis